MQKRIIQQAMKVLVKWAMYTSQHTENQEFKALTKDLTVTLIKINKFI